LLLHGCVVRTINATMGISDFLQALCRLRCLIRQSYGQQPNMQDLPSSFIYRLRTYHHS